LVRLMVSVRRLVVAPLVAVILFGQMGAVDAKAAPVVPPPDGDPDESDGLVRPARSAFESCDGDFGYGKFGGLTARSTVVVSGLRDDDYDQIRLEDAVGHQAVFVSTSLPVDGLLVELEVLDCTAANFSFLSEFTPRPEQSVAFLLEGEVVCEVVLPTPVWWRETLNISPAEFWVLSYDQDGELISDDDFDNAAEHEAAYTELLADFFGSPPQEEDFAETDDYLAAVGAWRAALPRADCAGRSNGDSDVSRPHPVAVSCVPEVVPVGALVECSVTGGDPGIGILWRASTATFVAGEGVFLDDDGRGTFSFRVPASVGQGPILVELVAWDRAVTVSVAGPLVPARIPAGEGRSSGGLPSVVLLLTGAALAVVGVRRRSLR
jgi:hypothetical protein